VLPVTDNPVEALNTALLWLDYAGVAVFAASGALVAARHKQDIITFGFFAAITGVGGGTLRDLLIDAPVFWVQRPGYIMICLAIALLAWFLAGFNWRFRALAWLDALGISAFSVVGAAKALSLGVHPFSAMLMGIFTAIFGGVIRDVLAGQPNFIVRREIYISATILGAGLFVGLRLVGLSFWPAGLAGFGAAFALRAVAITYGLHLPSFGHKPPPHPHEDPDAR